MKKYNAELSNIIPFTEDGCWYLKLIYKYEDKMGEHTVVIPKAAIPFNKVGLFVALQESEVSKHRLATSDIITEYASREMTLDEIEKELGYKVKIINKENKKNA